MDCAKMFCVKSKEKLRNKQQSNISYPGFSMVTENYVKLILCLLGKHT